MSCRLRCMTLDQGVQLHGKESLAELLLQLQIVQNEAVAVVGYAEAVRGRAIGSSSEVGADPGGQSGARVERPIQLRSTPGLSRGSCRRF